MSEVIASLKIVIEVLLPTPAHMVVSVVKSASNGGYFYLFGQVLLAFYNLHLRADDYNCRISSHLNRHT